MFYISSSKQVGLIKKIQPFHCTQMLPKKKRNLAVLKEIYKSKQDLENDNSNFEGFLYQTGH